MVPKIQFYIFLILVLVAVFESIRLEPKHKGTVLLRFTPCG